MTKIIAFYLPQFHSIPENDAWWGTGFTEWTNVQRAKTLFSGHNQPRIPFENNYYYLNDVNTLYWQADLMSRYGVDGLCFYHYWFNGKLLLETPLRLLLEHPEINMPFCLSWANEPWTRAWDGGDKEIIMAQEYGDEKDWEIHFEYLFKAFIDPRYIKVDDKPMLVIYRAANIKNFDNMIAYWRRRALEEGLLGLHIVTTNTAFRDAESYSNFDAEIDFEPMHTISHHFSKRENLYRKLNNALSLFRNISFSTLSVNIISFQSYDRVWRKIISRPIRPGLYPGVFVDWDNSPRKGAKRSLIMSGYSISKFEKYFLIKFSQAVKNNTNFIFLNAWNEWAEGTYLEPDTSDGFLKLEVIKKAKLEG